MTKARNFHKNKDKLLTHIYNLNKFGKLKVCKATTSSLAGMFNPPMSERQIYRYLKQLKEEGKITVTTSGLQRDIRKDKLYKQRSIKITSRAKISDGLQVFQELVQNKGMKRAKAIGTRSVAPAVSKSATVKVVNLPTTFSSPPVQRKPIPFPEEVIKAEEKVEVKKEPTEAENKAFWDDIDRYMASQGYTKMRHPKEREIKYLALDYPDATFEELCKMQDEKDRREAEEEFLTKTKLAWDTYVESTTGRLASQLSVDKPDQSGWDTLWTEHLKNKKRIDEDRVWMENEEKKDYSDQEWQEIITSRRQQEMQSLVENTKFIDNKFILTVYLGGLFSKEVDLLEYMEWNNNSESFILFKQEFKNIKGEV